jgi:hypothetical protein
MVDQHAPAATAAIPEDDEELLGRIDALRVLRADSPEEKGRLLEELGGSGKVEQDIVSELAKVRALWRPDQFDAVHRMAMRLAGGARQRRPPGPAPPARGRRTSAANPSIGSTG